MPLIEKNGKLIRAGCPPGQTRVKGKCLGKQEINKLKKELIKKTWYLEKVPKNPDDIILVNTPKPYAIDPTYDQVNEITEKEFLKTKYKLEKKARNLWRIIDLLEIPEKEAIENGYTLNVITWETLRNIAVNKMPRSQKTTRAMELMGSSREW